MTTTLAKPGKYLTFRISDESYGIAVLKVREIIKIQPITRIPEMPLYIKGVINLRGKIIPVIDLKMKLGMEEVAATDSTCIIVVNLAEGTSQIGVIVDGVEEVSNIVESELENPPDFLTQQDIKCILGMAKIKGVVKTLLDIDEVIGNENLELLRRTT